MRRTTIPSIDNRPGWESIDQPLWDSATMPVPASEVDSTRIALFRIPIGGSDVGGIMKTTADTNMVLSSQLPRHNEYLIDRITLLVPEGDEEDRMRFYWEGELMLAIGQKRYLTLPFMSLFGKSYENDRLPLLVPESMVFGVDVMFGRAPRIKRPLRFIVELGGILFRRYKLTLGVST